MWWTLLHHLKRALTILLLELAFRAEHMPSDAGVMVAEAKAAINWLHQIGQSNTDARRTCSHMRQLLRLAAQKVGEDTSDMASSSEEDAAAKYEQPPLVNYDNTNQNAFRLYGDYGGPPVHEQLPYYGDMTAWNELDQFGFLRAEGGMGSLFPTTSENEAMGGGQGEDYDMEGGFGF